MRTIVSLPDRSVTCCNLKEIHKQLKGWLIEWKEKIKGRSNEITYDESVIKWCEDVGYTEYMLSLSNSRPKCHVILLHFPCLPFRLFGKPITPNQKLRTRTTIIQKNNTTPRIDIGEMSGCMENAFMWSVFIDPFSLSSSKDEKPQLS